ncbi:MAG TPA: 23S rRNA (pseudouridine(1915)-N(3))-methyltransferase RlmH [Candidatus Onthocola stercoravium]|nr:23S rRNA (pseudouridine(1915)-N(3))-methyltransferase RlmH [Candidatus Onthocola stercoravium]
MIKILCVGKIKEKYLKDLIDDYEKRISKYMKIEIIELKDDPIYTKEITNLNSMINMKDYNVALDLRGEKLSSEEFANFVDKTLVINSNITFIIGPSDGLNEEILNKCNKIISFSDLTFPHGLFRGILLEQIYRAFKIIHNETYHK